jgi:hypothetical protein
MVKCEQLVPHVLSPHALRAAAHAFRESPRGVLGIGSNEGAGLLYLSEIPDLRFRALQGGR